MRHVFVTMGTVVSIDSSGDAPLELIISFIAYILPFSLTFTIPWGFLTAVLLVFGKMSAEHDYLVRLLSSRKIGDDVVLLDGTRVPAIFGADLQYDLLIEAEVAENAIAV